jgi:uncharacterized protein (TIGR02271 family)
MANENMDRVVPLSQLDDMSVADGQPDIRGWKVSSADGKEIGKVEELLVDRSAMKVRYLDVDLDNSMVAGGGRHVTIPVTSARLDTRSDRVIVSGMQADDCARLPEYRAGAFNDTSYESTVNTAFASRPSTSREMDTNEQHLTLAEEQLAIGKRSVAAGEVSVGKRVETRHEEQTVPVMHEEVSIERRPLTGMEAAGAQIGDQEIRVPVREEEVVAEKRTVAKEELVVRKHEVQGEERVAADLRTEHAEIHREGDVQVRGDAAGMTDRDLTDRDRNRGL